MPDLSIVYRPVAALQPYAKNARRHPKKQIKQIAASIREIGFVVPVIVDRGDSIIAGHGRVEAAKALGMEQVPTVQLDGLTEAQVRTLRLADNKLALGAEWDWELVAEELESLSALNVDLDLTGFSQAEIDLNLDAIRESDPRDRPPEDETPGVGDVAVSRPGDLWALGRHLVLCGDARSADDIARLMNGQQVDLVFTDPPYNVPIDGHARGRGRVRHRDFDMAVGEMSQAEFTAFLAETLGNAAGVCRDGAIAFVCMDWRHIGELLSAGARVFSELKQLCVWNKANGGMGAFYRSKHEMVFVFKVGQAEHINTFGLGETGRHRTNVWDYPGVTSFGSGRDEALAIHPTVKPVALVADAIKDCSKRGGLVLDPFGGSGSTLIAAQTCGRSARLIEYDPLYCDTIIRRYERYTGKTATLLDTGQSFELVTAARREGSPNV